MLNHKLFMFNYVHVLFMLNSIIPLMFEYLFYLFYLFFLTCMHFLPHPCYFLPFLPFIFFRYNA